MYQVLVGNQIAEAVLKEKGSKFVAFVFSIEDENDFKSKMAEFSKQHAKSQHQCFAFRLFSSAALYEKYNDDGEPKNSAGLPILNQLRSSNLINTGAVVYRYFGGTKLGISGLIQAYKGATELALIDVLTKTFIEKTTITLIYDYSSSSAVDRALYGLQFFNKNQEFTEIIKLTLEIAKVDEEKAKEKLSNWTIQTK